MLESIKKYLNEFKSGTKTMFKEFFNKSTNKKQRANMWTFQRIIVPIITLILSIISIINGIYPLLIAASAIATFGSITDFLDGRSSRKHKSSSEYGKLLDQVTDKFFSFIIAANISYFNIFYLIVILGESLIASTNFYYKKKYKNINIESTKIGKIKQGPLFISLILGYLAPLNNICLTISSISVLITFIFQIMTTLSYIKQNSNEAKKMEVKSNQSANLNQIEEEKVKNKSLQLTKNKGEVNNDMSKKDEYKNQYMNLRNLLNQIIDLKNEELNPVNNQKTKRIK